MGIEEMWEEFHHYCDIYPCDDYKQGVDIHYPFLMLDKGHHGVYVMRNMDYQILKIGCTQCLRTRFQTMYKHVRNTTNNRIRDYVKTEGPIRVWVYDVHTYDEEILGHTVQFTPIHSLERHIIQAYKDKAGELPLLNVVHR